MWEVNGNDVSMAEHDFGLKLPFTIHDLPITANDTIKMVFKRHRNDEPILEKDYTNIVDKTIELDTYTYTVSGDSVIAVVIGGSAPTQTLSYKDGSTWRSATKAYKKVSGTWVQQSDLSTVFEAGKNYVKG